ncbi:MAG TPA: GNAT family N-acetyltransferase [Acidimicrobiales bacterium]
MTAVLAGDGDVEPLADVLQAAFFDDPVSTWILPDEASRARRLARFFALYLHRHYLPMRTAWTTSSQAGAALWAPPGHWRLPPAELLRTAPALLRIGGRHAGRAARLFTEVERRHPQEPHWYLGVLGTDPSRQGQGIGSALLKPVLDRCDREGVPAYLESSKESNVPFYRRHGFEVTAEITAPSGGPTLWGMWRETRLA